MPAAAGRALRVVAMAAAGLTAIVAALFLAVAGGGANGIVRAALAAKLHRPVKFDRVDLRLFSGDPTIALTNLVVASPREITPDDLLRAKTVILHLRTAPLLLARIELKAVSVDGGELHLVRLGHARNNYSFGSGGSGKLLGGVTSLSVTHSSWTLHDPDRHIVMAGPIQHGAGAGSRLALLMQGQGSVSEEPVSVILRGGALNGRRPDAPWPVDIHVVDGAARLDLEGVSQAPFDFRGFDLKVNASGPNLAVLGALLRTETPNSPPFTLIGQATRTGHVVQLSKLKARLGRSDVVADITSDHSQPRRRISSALKFATLHAADVAVLASPPASHAQARSTPGTKPGSGEAVGLRKPIPVPALRKLDAEVELGAAHVEGYGPPLSDLSVRLALNDGRLALRPVRFRLASGAVAAEIVVDASRRVPSTALRAHLDGARLTTLRPKLRSMMDGDLYASADLAGFGPSLQAMLASASGRADFRLANGRLKKAPAAVLVGDPLLAGGAILGGKTMQPLNCAVGHLTGKGGVFTVDRLALATPAGTAEGAGSVDLARARLDLRLRGRPARRFAIASPAVSISGPLAHPKVSIDKAGLAASGVANAAVALVTAPVTLLAGKGAPPPAPAACSRAPR